MAFDLLITDALVVDGTGSDAFTADVAVTDGRIAAIGTELGDARRTIEGRGRVLAPGFIDVHTHYDAQLHFDGLATPSSSHGVTTVIMGNCGFTLAPSKPPDLVWLLQMLSRVEGMSAAALGAGVDFAGGSVGDFLDGLDGRVAVNAAVYVGHAAVRRWVMGPDASTRVATPAEIVAMAELVRRAMHDGAIGFSTSQLDIHADHQGLPVPPNLAAADELVALAAVLGEFDHGMVECLPRTGSSGFDEADQQLLLDLARASGKPVHIQPLTRFPGDPDLYRRVLAFCEDAERQGLHIRPMSMINVKGIHFSLADTFMFDEMPTFRSTLTLPVPECAARLADPELRATLQREVDDREGRSFAFEWSEMSVASSSRGDLVGRTVTDIADAAGVHPLDALLDTSLAEDLATVWVWERSPHPDDESARSSIVTHPLTLPGSSDGGAHLATFCGADYTTRCLIELVPDVLSLEAAVNLLSKRVAEICGLDDRGEIAVGKRADLVIFDPDELSISPIRWAEDLPTGAGRFLFDATGYAATIVNGEPVLLEGEPTGAHPGQPIRAGR